jgi:colanic acid/amylovoran biosynthesis glycosyltransferase
MDIAFFVNKFPNVSETFILNQITGLIDRGLRVTIYARERSNDSIIHPDIEKYNLTSRTIYYSECYPRIPKNIIIRYLKAVTLIFKHKDAVKFFYRAMNLRKFGRQSLSLFNIYKVAAFIKLGLGQFEIVHCHFGPNGNIAIFLKNIGIIRGKVVTVFHAYELTRLIKDQGEHIYDHLFKIGDMFMPISYNWKNKLETLGCPSGKIVVHRMGVDIERFKYIDRSTLSNGTIKILSVARLVEKKGIEYAIRAFARANPREKNVEYIIAGDGPLRNELECLSRSLGVDNRIEFIGWKNQDEISDILKLVHIFLLPSVTSTKGDQEGVPVVLMEAMAQGIPVISTYHSGIPELVDDGISGFLVPERDINLLSEKIQYLIDHREMWHTLGRAGRQKVEHNFNIHKLNDILFDHFSNLLMKE